MKKIAIFGGTTEGRVLAELCEKNKIPALVFVATDYGQELILSQNHIRVLRGRKDKEEMKDIFINNDISLVFDATHPYARVVSDNIIKSCNELCNIGKNIEYIRVMRDSIDLGNADGSCLIFESIESAVEYLKNTEGNIFIATGSKQLKEYEKLDIKRLYARVLPNVEGIEACKSINMESSHIIAMQGPFDEALNSALLKQYACKYMVTKESGNNGGFIEKIRACKSAGAKALIIGRVMGDSGIDIKEALKKIYESFNIEIDEKEDDILKDNNTYQTKEADCNIKIIGIGPGSINTMTKEAIDYIGNADILIGQRRMLAAGIELRKYLKKDIDIPCIDEYSSQAIIEFLKNNSESYKRIALLVSGDSGFYSGASNLYKTLSKEVNNKTSSFYNYDIGVLSGVSSLSYMASKLCMSWNDAYIMSVHGKEKNVADKVLHHKKVFMITSGEEKTAKIINSLVDAGLGSVDVYVGEMLSYAQEKLFKAKAYELESYSFAKICSLIIINEAAKNRKICIGIDENEFIRDKVPMTKDEIRAISVSKLKLDKASVCYDIGAGSGSVSIEMAKLAYEGRVYAIEKKELAYSLTQKNIEKFKQKNIELILGEATEVIDDLPVPTHVFIGGSSGNMKKIIDMIFNKNPYTKVVINAIALETISQINDVCKYYKTIGYNIDIVMASIAKAKTVGSYNMMIANNPVLIAGIMKEELCNE